MCSSLRSWCCSATSRVAAFFHRRNFLVAEYPHQVSWFLADACCEVSKTNRGESVIPNQSRCSRELALRHQFEHRQAMSRGTRGLLCSAELWFCQRTSVPPVDCVTLTVALCSVQVSWTSTMSRFCQALMLPALKLRSGHHRIPKITVSAPGSDSLSIR